MDKKVKEFYHNFCSNINFSQENKIYEENLKKEYFSSILNDEKLYKFISFSDDKNLNTLKLNSLKKQELWFGAHYTFKDDTELQIKVNPYKVVRFTNLSPNEIFCRVNNLRELKDICCFTTNIRDVMWKEYANDYNGICLEFRIKSYEYIMPVIYTNKNEVDYSNDLISALNSTKEDNYNVRVLAFEPFVLKDKNKYQYEDEVRLLCADVYDDANGEMGGAIWQGKKQLLGYKGINYSYSYVGLELVGVYIGKNLDENIKEDVINIILEQKINIVAE